MTGAGVSGTARAADTGLGLGLSAAQPEAGFTSAFWTAGRLWVLHTRARQENRVAESLERRAVPFYLPLVASRRTYGRRVVEFQVPLFPGYVFLSGDEAAVEVAWRTKRVAQVLRVTDPDTLRCELKQVARVIRAGTAVNLYPGLKAGRRCRVIAGPLAGTEGVVLRWRNPSRLYLAVTFIGQSAVVEIDAAVLEAVE